VARHLSEAGLIEKAVHFWGKAGQRSLERSSLVEAIEQLSNALAKITTLPTSRALRHEEIKLQVALITPLLNVKGFSAGETKTATERACLLIEHAESLGEPLEDPLLLFSVLFGNWVANFVAYNGEVLRELAVQYLALAEKQAVTAPLIVGHQIMGISLATTGEFIQAREHYDRALALYDPAVHRALLTRVAAAITDLRVVPLSFRSRQTRDYTARISGMGYAFVELAGLTRLSLRSGRSVAGDPAELVSSFVAKGAERLPGRQGRRSFR
jgi:tetratricopeptide (TPR) repeat protein